MPSGYEVDNLPETYVIFITEHDVFGRNKPIYHVDRFIRETEEFFGDGSHIIYVNATYKDDKEGISTMSKIVEEMIKEEKKSIAIQILKLGKVTVDEVAKCVDLSVEEVKELASTSHRT